MGTALPITIHHTDGAARMGTIQTPRGQIQTPVFMPVGTRGAVKTLDTGDMEALETQIMLGNTYHLMERPTAEVIEELGGLHRFLDWDGHLLTDSGGFQVFSLKPKVSEDGATFRSIYDGSLQHLTPERAVKVQEQLGADIAMALDVVPALPAPEEVVRDAMERTLRWAERNRQAHSHPTQAQFGIVQGGTNLDLRAESAARTVEIGFDGYAVGGLSVGESRDVMIPALAVATAELPEHLPRYFMGLGDPIGLIEAVNHGIDMFDCVLPTRLARHGTALTSEGRLNLKRAEFRTDDSPIDPNFIHPLSGRYSRGYLRHLLKSGEPTAGRIITLHNLAWLTDLTTRMRSAIAAGTFQELRAEIYSIWDDEATE